MTHSTRPGRPRDEVTRRAILQATRDLLVQNGYEQTSIHAVAARAGAGRQTVYRWWNSKSELVGDVVIEGYLSLPSSPVQDTGCLRTDIRSWLERAAALKGTPGAGPLLRALAAAASENEEQAARLYTTITGPVHESLTARLAQAKTDGQLRTETSETAMADALLATALFRLLVPTPPGAEIDGALDVLLGGVECSAT